MRLKQGWVIFLFLPNVFRKLQKEIFLFETWSFYGNWPARKELKIVIVFGKAKWFKKTEDVLKTMKIFGDGITY